MRRSLAPSSRLLNQDLDSDAVTVPAKRPKNCSVSGPADATQRNDKENQELSNEKNERKTQMTDLLPASTWTAILFRSDYSRSVLTRPFKCPLPNAVLSQSTKTLGVRKTAALSCPFSVEDEDSFVLYHALGRLNKNGRPFVNVIVDPILTKFLRPHQREGVQFMFDCLAGIKNGEDYCGCILADEMGLGKTFQTVTVIWTLLKQSMSGGPTVRKILIASPASLVKNWHNELLRWIGTNRIQPISVQDSGREKVLKAIEDFQTKSMCPVLIMSYETFRTYAEILQSKEIGMLVCDEAHKLKNSQAQVTQAIAGLKTKRIILLSGTPIQNDLDEFFSMVEVCNKGILGTVAEFRKNYEHPILQSRDALATDDERKKGEEKSQELCKKINGFVLRRTSSILNQYLPPKVEQVVFCRMSSLQLSLYRHFLSSKQGRAMSSGKASGVLNSITELKKLCCHPCLIYEACTKKEPPPGFEGALQLFPPDYKPNLFQPKFSGKFDVLTRLLNTIRDQTDDGVVLVSNYTQTLDVFETMSGANRYSYLRLDGSVTTKQRQKLVDKFNDRNNKIFLFLLSSKAGGCGLNIIGANRLVLFDPDWNPANDAQAMGRVWRDGQKKKVWIYRFLSTGSIEEKIYQRQVSKKGLSSVVIDEQDSTRHFSAEDLRELFTLHENTPSDTHDRLQCSCPSSKRKAEIMETIQEEDEQGCNPMEEISRWKHCPVPHASKDPILKTIPGEIVSFIFGNGY